MAIRIRKNKKHTSNITNGYTPSKLLEIAKLAKLSTAPLDLISLCQNLGLLVKFMPLEDNVSGRLENIGGRWVIIVNSLHHERRQRFTIAHELAHYCLHRNNSNFEDVVFHRGLAYSSEEREADNFAGSLLMPKDDLIQFINTQSNKIETISEHFGVSGIAVKTRADIIKKGNYEY